MDTHFDEISVGNRQPEGIGLIFDIQGHSVHDGPGTRTTVFLNGCPLHCSWCCNPEGLFRRPVLMYRASKCKCCGDCIQACPSGSVQVVNGLLTFNRKNCDACLEHECVKACLNESVVESGKYYSQAEVLRILRRDRQFWGSNGGVSFSGGEPLLQSKFISSLLRECKKQEMHTCVETTSFLPTDYYLDTLAYVDWVFTDIKHMDSETHKKITGQDNSLILHNITALVEADWDGVIMPRIPVIPSMNDSEENILATVKFIKNLGIDAVNILPFHRLGESKYRQLGKEYDLAEQPSPPDEKMQQLKALVESQGIYCLVGWETPF